MHTNPFLCFFSYFSAECSYTYINENSPIEAQSEKYEAQGFSQCEYNISAPRMHYIALNFTKLFGFGAVGAGAARMANACSPDVLVLDGQASPAPVICSNRPAVFHTQSNSIKVVYIWTNHRKSGFTLLFDFHKSKWNWVEISSLKFRCLEQDFHKSKWNWVEISSLKFRCLEQDFHKSKWNWVEISSLKFRCLEQDFHKSKCNWVEISSLKFRCLEQDFHKSKWNWVEISSLKFRCLEQDFHKSKWKWVEISLLKFRCL